MKAALSIVLLLLSALCLAQTAPVVSNVTAAQRTDGSKLVDVWYNLFDAEGDLCSVTLKLSINNGTTYDFMPALEYLSGDVGLNVASGTGKHILWDTAAEGWRLDSNQFRIRILAEDSNTGMPASFIFVPGGTFSNGTSNITLSSFYLDKYEVTQSQYESVMGVNPAQGVGIGPSNPVFRMSWYNVIEYCNRRSLLEELTPAYSYDTFGSDPDDWPNGWDEDDFNYYNIACNWTVNGYRMPTEMEWMYAARGGNQSQGYIYSGSNTLADVAWYVANGGETTHMVGLKVPNELGFYDMSGNVWECLWDIWTAEYLPGDQTDPHGPDEGTYRTSRGGGYNTLPEYCTTSFHNCGGMPTDIYYSLGFRLCRSMP